MTKKKQWLAVGLNIFCALIWTVNFFLHWHKDGMIRVSMALFGVSAALFTLAAVLSVINVFRRAKESTVSKEEQ